MSLKPNDVLNGRYRIEAVLRAGSFVVSYRAFDEQQRVPCVVQELQASAPALGGEPAGLQTRLDQAVVEQFLEESRVLLALRHPNVLPLVAVFSTGGRPYRVLDAIPGQTLAEKLAAGPQMEGQALEWIGQVADALAYCHSQGLSHGNVRPEHILIGENGQAYLTGLGGTGLWPPLNPAADVYRPPGAGSGSDSYALGVTLWEALTGQRLPYTGADHGPGQPLPPPSILAPTLSREVDLLVQRAVAPDPAGRFGSPAELKRAVDQATGRREVLPSPLALPPLPAPAPRLPWLVALAVALLLLAGVALGMALARRSVPASPALPSVPSASAPAANQSSPPTGLPVVISDVTRTARAINLGTTVDPETAVVAATTPRALASPLPLVTLTFTEPPRLTAPALTATPAPPILSPAPGHTPPAPPTADLVINLGTASQVTQVATPNGLGRVGQMAWSADGQTLVIASALALTAYRAPALEQLWMQPADRALYSVAMDQNGAVVTGARDGSIRRWNLATGAPLEAPPSALIWPVDNLVIQADGTILATWNDGAYIHLWRSGSPSQEPSLRGDTGLVATLAFSADGSLLAGGQVDGTIILWDTRNGQVWQTLASPRPVKSLAFSPDGQYLAAGDAAPAGIRQAHVWRRPPGSTVYKSRSDFNQYPDAKTFDITSLAFANTPDGLALAGGSEGAKTSLWLVSGGSQSFDFLPGDYAVDSLAFAPNGRHLATVEANGAVTVAVRNSARDYQTLGPILGYSSEIHSLAFAPDSQTLAYGGADFTVRLRDVATQVDTQTVLALTTWALNLAFSPTGDWLASSWGDNVVRLWPLPAGASSSATTARPPAGNPVELRKHANSVWGLAFSPDGHWLASADDSGGTWLWPMTAAPSQPTPVPLDYDGNMRSLAFSADSRLLAAAGADGAIRLWDVNQRQPFRQPYPAAGHDDFISLAFSPALSRTLAFGGAGQTVSEWDLTTGQVTPMTASPAEQHQDRIRALAYSPDGQVLASASDDGTIKLWDTALLDKDRYKLLATLTGHTDRIVALAFSPNGHWLASGSYDGTVRVWGVR